MFLLSFLGSGHVGPTFLLLLLSKLKGKRETVEVVDSSDPLDASLPYGIVPNHSHAAFGPQGPKPHPNLLLQISNIMIHTLFIMYLTPPSSYIILFYLLGSIETQHISFSQVPNQLSFLHPFWPYVTTFDLNHIIFLILSLLFLFYVDYILLFKITDI